MKIFNKLLIYVSVIAALAACKQDEDELKLNPPPTASFTTAPSAANPNYIVVTSTSTGHDALLWNFGNGVQGISAVDTAYYPYPGEYEITLTAFSNGGKNVAKTTVTVTTTDPDLCNNQLYTLLTGGCAAPNGKTWVIDANTNGHLGVGPSASNTADWWNAPPLDKDGLGIYDDEYTFNINNAAFQINNNGDAFAHNEHLDRFSNTTPGSDQKVSYEAPTNSKWVLSIEDGKTYLSVTEDAFIGFWTGASKYEVLSLTENEMYLRNLDSKAADRAWYTRLIVKGSTPEPEPEPETGKALESHDISETFDADGSMTWNVTQIESFDENFANPESDGTNSSAKVGKYVKGNPGPNSNGTDNLQFDLDYRLDLSTRNKFRIKVYAPSTNDYTTVGTTESWQTNYNTLQKQVSVKLQDSTNPEPWNGQAERIQTISATDEWVVLEFDFSDISTSTNYDRILIQIGGEGNYTPGTFYIDDFELL